MRTASLLLAATFYLASCANDKKAEEVKQKEETKTQKQEKGFFDNPIVKSVARTAGNTIVRSLLGAIGMSGGSRRKKKSWF